MDLIHMNAARKDVGVMEDYTFDLAFGEDENDFECQIVLGNHCCEAGDYLYFENTEYGGIVDSIAVETDNDVVTYLGRTWHGIMDSKVIEPDAGQDYFVVNGEANGALGNLIVRLGLGGLFKASEEDSGINIERYKMNRYITGYQGIRKMLKAFAAKLQIRFKKDIVELSAVPLVDYSQDEQFDTDQIDFSVRKNSHPMNHVVCLGKGDLAEREVIHIYTDSDGNVSCQQSLMGISEVAGVYDNANAESGEELEKRGRELLMKAWNSDKIEFRFSSNAETFDIGDIVGAREYVTGIEVREEITKKIVTIKNNTTSISYKAGE